MNETSIPWVRNPDGTQGFTWNPITGCTRGCDYCYARAIAHRFGDSGGDPKTDALVINAHDFRPLVHFSRLGEPLRTRKPWCVFLGSMGDVFDPAFPDDFRDRIFATVAATPQHTYLLLTKQPKEMQRYFKTRVPPNLWIGVTVTNQADADERIPLLLDTPAAHRFVSVEPMQGAVDLSRWLSTFNDSGIEYGRGLSMTRVGCLKPRLDWVVVGAKTPGKPLHEQTRCSDKHFASCELIDLHASPNDCNTDAWCPKTDAPAYALRSLRDQCEAAGVPFFYKHGKDTPALDGVVHDATPWTEAGQ